MKNIIYSIIVLFSLSIINCQLLDAEVTVDKKKLIILTNENETNEIADRIYSANVYIDSSQIKESLSNDANIVLAGRVTDPGLTLGPLMHEFNWNKDDYNKIASGTLAGHII